MAGMDADTISGGEAHAQRHKTALLYRNAGIALTVNVILASLTAYGNVMLQAAPVLAAGWWGALVALALGRYRLARRFHAAKPSDRDDAVWRHRYVVATAMVAAAWGAASVLFMWNGADGARLLTGLALAGIVAGSVPILAPVPAAFRTYALLIALPLGTVIVLQASSAFHWAFAAMALVFFGTVLASGRMLHEALDASIGLGLEKGRLLDALQRSEARFRLLSSATFEGVAITENGRFIDANEQLLKMLGFAREELIGLPIESLLPEEARERVMGNVRAGRESFVEHAMVRKDGGLIEVEAHGQTIDNGGRPIRITALRDITMRKRNEAELEQHRHHLEDLVRQRTAALRETEARASHILHSSADGLYGVDHDGIITFINPAACEKLGYRAAQVVGRSAHAVFHHTRPDGTPYPVDDCPSHNAVRMGRKLRVDNEVYWHADGHAVPVMYAVHPMIQDGVNIGAVISFVDMSEQRAAAQARENALVAAENLARVRSEFLANMSHEIRTPLNGVLGFARIGRRACHDADKARDAFDKILASGNLLLGIINDVLDFSKIEAGKIHIEHSEVALREVVAHAVDLIEERARAKRLELHVHCAPDLPSICITDRLRLNQVLLNLLSNAVKFTEAGRVTLAAARDGAELVFRISDTGIGMSADELGRLFNPFQQADGSITRKFGGTGLGLAISRRILELMGGDIRVDSEPGRGSTFEFRLPLILPRTPAGESSGGAGEPDTPVGKPLAGITVLVAEDDTFNQMVLEEYLIDAGATVVLAADGFEAVERVRSEGPAYDVVLMDVQMPEMDGYEATRRIHALAPGLPVIGQTAHAYGEGRENCFAAGMVAHIAKPIDPVDLVELIGKHAGRAPREAGQCAFDAVR